MVKKKNQEPSIKKKKNLVFMNTDGKKILKNN